MRIVSENREPQREYFAVAKRQIKHMTRLIDELQGASRLDPHKLSVDFIDSSLNEILSDPLAAVRERVEARRHTLSVRALAHDVRLVVDPVRLTQVIVTLLSNAIRYTPGTGQIDLNVERKCTGAKDGIEILIRDNGIGIDAAMLPRIFEPFAQFAGAAARLEGGLGIGMSIAQRLTQLHGGTIVVTSAGRERGIQARSTTPVRAAAADEAGT
ncbi:histidine kinase/DNA gyrase B/HSP90-like ATPase [Paraburkholderia unamae]|nr:histidine kinase/DNA gyrase B/HSP90-like ATPase [Paraburkholderia unamae]